LHILAISEQKWGSYLTEAVHVLVLAGARFDDSSHCSLLKSRCLGDHVMGSLLEEALDYWANKPPLNADLIGMT
jgi:hypothetical protein